MKETLSTNLYEETAGAIYVICFLVQYQIILKLARGAIRVRRRTKSPRGEAEVRNSNERAPFVETFSPGRGIVVRGERTQSDLESRGQNAPSCNGSSNNRTSLPASDTHRMAVFHPNLTFRYIEKRKCERAAIYVCTYIRPIGHVSNNALVGHIKYAPALIPSYLQYIPSA